MEQAPWLADDDVDLAGFLTAVATPEPLPAGMAVAALTGALVAALTEMVAALRLKQRPEHPAELHQLRADALRWRGALLRAITDDSAAYRAYMAARALPRSTPGEKRTRQQALARTRLVASQTPLEIAGMAYDLLGFLHPLAQQTRPALRSDLATAAILAEAVVRAAVLAIHTNLRDHPEPDEAGDLLAQADRLAANAATACATIVDLAEERSS